MNHIDDGTLQAFLDDELSPEERARVAEHLLGCARCHQAHQELGRANATFSEAVSLLDVEVPGVRSGSARAGRADRARSGTRSFVRAAGLILAVAAAASAAVPGSPVREWIVSAVESTGGAGDTGEEVPSARAPAAAPSGVSLAPGSGPAVVSLQGLQRMVIRLRSAESGAVSASVLGADSDPLFRTGAGRIEVMDGVGGEVHVVLPTDARGSRLEVDGELYAEIADGGLRVVAPADTVGGSIVWR